MDNVSNFLDKKIKTQDCIYYFFILIGIIVIIYLLFNIMCKLSSNTKNKNKENMTGIIRERVRPEGKNAYLRSFVPSNFTEAPPPGMLAPEEGKMYGVHLGPSGPSTKQMFSGTKSTATDQMRVNVQAEVNKGFSFLRGNDIGNTGRCSDVINKKQDFIKGKTKT